MTARRRAAARRAAALSPARRTGSVGVVMRVKGEQELSELELLPKDGKRYEQGNLVILIFPQVPS